MAGTNVAGGTKIFGQQLEGRSLRVSPVSTLHGIVYLSGNQVYAVAPDGSNVVTYDADASSRLLGGENTVVYFTHNSEMNVAAANLGCALHGFSTKAS
ncbi:MAG: hypothetical protein M3Y57_20665 [Acidobacteriota bacterium]|nr:hypothetical protein [Acidobacteriota bacterium]